MHLHVWCFKGYTLFVLSSIVQRCEVSIFSFQHNTDSTFRGYDHNVLPVWGQGVTGKNVVVSILDDGKFYFPV